MLRFLIIVFAYFCVFAHRKIISAVFMSLNKIPQVYRSDAAHLWTTPENPSFTQPSLLSIVGEEEGTAKSIMAF